MKVDYKKSLTKTISRGAQIATAITVAFATVPIPPDFGVSKRATVITILSLTGALLKGAHDIVKTKLTPILITVLLLAGCQTTTTSDGTVITNIDPVALETAWSAYERYQIRKAALEAEKIKADKERQAQILEELRLMVPEINRLAERLGLPQ